MYVVVVTKVNFAPPSQNFFFFSFSHLLCVVYKIYVTEIEQDDKTFLVEYVEEETTSK